MTIDNNLAESTIEVAAIRVRNAIAPFAELLNNMPTLSSLNTELDELRAAVADLYDGGIDYVLDVRHHGQAAKSLDGIWDSVDKLTNSLGALSQTRTLEVTLDADGEPLEIEHPTTGYGVRVTFADGSGYDIDNVDAVQIHDKATKRFPFGFVDPDGEGHKPVYWAAEDGKLHHFPAIAAPTPNNGW